MERVKEVLGYASEKAGCSARHEGAARRDVGGAVHSRTIWHGAAAQAMCSTDSACCWCRTGLENFQLISAKSGGVLNYKIQKVFKNQIGKFC